MVIAELFASLGLRPDEASWKRGEALIEGVKKGLEIFAGYEAVKFIGELVKSTAEAAIGAERMAQKVGISTEAVQELGYAAQVTGISAEEMQHGFQHLAIGLQEAHTKGTGPLVEGLQQLGVSFSAVANKSPDEILAVLADRFAAMPDGAKKTAAAMDIFGRAGANLIPLLNKGGDGIGELRKEAEELSVVIDDKTAKSFEGLEESTLKIKGTLTGLKNTVVTALLPVIKDMAESLFEWVRANREIIASTLKSVVEGLIVVIKAFGEGVAFVVEVAGYLREHSELLIGVLTILGALLLEIAADAVIAWAAALGPITLVIAAATALGVAIYKVWKSFKDGGVVREVFNWIGGKLSSFVDALKSAGSSIYDFFAGIGRFIRGVFEGVIDWIDSQIDRVKRAAKAVKDFFDTGDTIDGKKIDATQFYQGGGNVLVPPGSSSTSSTSTTVAAGAVEITVNIPPGADAAGMVSQMRQVFAEQFGAVLRDAHAATGGADQ